MIAETLGPTKETPIKVSEIITKRIVRDPMATEMVISGKKCLFDYVLHPTMKHFAVYFKVNQLCVH